MNFFTTNTARVADLEANVYDKQLSKSDNRVAESRTRQLPSLAMKNVVGTTSLLSAIKSLNYLSTVFGLTSLSPVETKLQGRKNGTFVRLRMCSCMWIAVYVASTCIGLLKDIHYVQSGTPGKITIVNVLYTISLYLTSVVSLCLCGVFRRHLISDIIDRLEAIINTFMKAVAKNIVKRTRKLIFLLEGLILGVSCFVNAVYIYRECEYSLWNCLPPVLETLSCMCNSLLIAQFVILVLILREQYKYINEILVKSAEDALRLPVATFQTGRPREVLSIENCLLPSRLPRNRLSQNNEIHVKSAEDALRLPMATFQTGRPRDVLSIENCLLPSRPPRNQLSQNQVFNCRLIMTKVISVSGLTGSYYGFPVLLATFWIFTDIVVVLYSLFFHLSTRYYKDELTKFVFILEHVMWCVYCAMLITMMALSCHLTSEEANTTMFHVQNILLHQNLGQDTIAELDKFSHQLSNMKNEITASGFFVLNLEFLYGFFGVTLAYFVIMFQLN